MIGQFKALPIRRLINTKLSHDESCGKWKQRVNTNPKGGYRLKDSLTGRRKKIHTFELLLEKGIPNPLICHLRSPVCGCMQRHVKNTCTEHSGIFRIKTKQKNRKKKKKERIKKRLTSNNNTNTYLALLLLGHFQRGSDHLFLPLLHLHLGRNHYFQGQEWILLLLGCSHCRYHREGIHFLLSHHHFWNHLQQAHHPHKACGVHLLNRNT